MKIAVLGLWHLGSVTAACVAEAGFETVGVDRDAAALEGLTRGEAPLFEPGLDDLLRAGIAAGTLRFSSDPAAVADADLVWVAYDTPVDERDNADTGFVTYAVEEFFPHLQDGAVVLVSSQLPAGTTRGLSQGFARARPGVRVHFACSPENLRLGSALQVFRGAERIVVGADDDAVRTILQPLLSRFTDEVLWVSVESAEMTKHAVNAFLATCVTFANEIASLCERVGADAFEVEQALRLEPRIGRRAYIRPGAAFAGGTLARDIVFLRAIAERTGLDIPLLGHVEASNTAHKTWPIRRLRDELGDLKDRRIALLGLVYKPGTSTLRRSWAVELAQSLADAGATVRGHDPALSRAPELDGVLRLETDFEALLSGADAAVVATEWPEYQALDASFFRGLMRRPLVIDPNRFLAKSLAGSRGLRYLSVGRA